MGFFAVGVLLAKKFSGGNGVQVNTTLKDTRITTIQTMFWRGESVLSTAFSETPGKE